MTAAELWRELKYYFIIRNCVTHHNGQIQKMRYRERLTKYAKKKGILTDNKGQMELALTQDFNREVCDTMKKFFSKLMCEYYGTRIPE